MQRPQSLMSGEEGAAALAALVASRSGASSVSFQRTQGFSGLDEFEPAGWQLQVGEKSKPHEPSSQDDGPALWPAGVGMALMNGCFGKNYAPGDPCYSFARPAPTCNNLIDAAAFIGVGFDGRGFYSANSRKMSIIQRVCNNKAKFMNGDVPDTMNAFGLWDYSIDTESFQDAQQYVKYLQEKAASSETEAMFQMEAESVQQGRSSGGNLGVIGAIAGAAVGAYAGGAQGAQMGAQVGQALGQSIGFNVGSSSGSGSASQNAQAGASRSASQSGSQASGSVTNMIALLEADLKLYEITLDEVKYSDMSTYFLTDFMHLPISYSDIGADVAIQSFIMKWGTHYIKSAKFGGELKIIKTSTRESKLSQEQFAEATQEEFSGMMGTLRSSFKQKESGFSFLGLGSKSRSSSQRSSATKEQQASSSASNVASGLRQNQRSEFIKTSIKVMGGNPTIGAAITDFYTPRFRETFVKWLDSVDDFVRPYEFTLGKVSSLLSSSRDLLFPNGDASTGGCFGQKVKKDDKTGMLYYLREVFVKDANNQTVKETVRNYCKYKNSDELESAIAKKRLALERGESIYMTEGPSSTSSFDIEAGKPGCELDALRYLSGTEETLRTWPSWENLPKSEFKVIFDMWESLPNIEKNAEYFIKYYGRRWYTRTARSEYSMGGSCLANPNKLSRKLCIVGIPVVYYPTDGIFSLDLAAYRKFNISVPLWLQQPLGRVEVLEGNINLGGTQLGKSGLVPCNLKWSNAHRVLLPVAKTDTAPTCLYFQAATEGSIHVMFAGLPENYKTWYSVRISKGSISFFEGMKLKKQDNSIVSGALGSKNIFEAYFICLKRDNKQLVIEYGKSPPDVELGVIYSAFRFSRALLFDRLFYAFGSGEKHVSVSDLRIIKEQRSRMCLGSLIEINGICQLDCHTECDGCHQSSDPLSCNRCKNLRVEFSETSFLCVPRCVAPNTKSGSKCICQAGFSPVLENGAAKCGPCPPGTRGTGSSCEDCPENTFSTASSSRCNPCPASSFSSRRSSRCGKMIASKSYVK